MRPFRTVFITLILGLTGFVRVNAASILIPMDETQHDHLKSYGIAFWVLKNGEEVDWLLNYRGGSFMLKYDQKSEAECKIRGVSLGRCRNAGFNLCRNSVHGFV